MSATVAILSSNRPSDHGRRSRLERRLTRTSVLRAFVNLIWPLSIVSFGPTPTLVVRFVDKPAAVGAVEKVEIARVVRDFQGRWEGRKTCFWFSSLSTDRLFPQPGGRRVFVFCKKHGSSLSSCELQALVPVRTSMAGLSPPDRTRVQTEGVRRPSWYPS